MDLTLSLYYIDSFNVQRKLDDYIIDEEDIVLEENIGNDYATLTFLIQNFDFNAVDTEERIILKYQVDDNPPVIYKFFIDGIVYKKNNVKKVFCKTATFLKQVISANVIKANSFQELSSKIYENLEFDALDYPIVFETETDGKTFSQVARDYADVIGAEIFYHAGKVYITNKKTIKENETPVTEFDEITNIINISTFSNKDKIKINQLNINVPSKSITKIISKPVINLKINPSSPCVSPSEELVYTDSSNNQYVISPVYVSLFAYYSPCNLSIVPQTNLPFTTTLITLIEEFTLNNDTFVNLAGGVMEIIGVSGDITQDQITYAQGYNTIAFPKTTGKLRISYKTNALYCSLPPQQKPITIPVSLKFLNQEINYHLKYELNGYYPLNLPIKFDVVGDFGFSYQTAINANFTISKFDSTTKAFVEITTIQSDSVGMFEYSFNDYGVYKFSTSDNSVIVEYFVNKKEIYKGTRDYSNYY